MAQNGIERNNMIISVDHEAYKHKRNRLSTGGKHNGAYYYAKEIEQNIIPNVQTDRNWILVNIPPHGANHSIVFIHNNLHPENYEWLKRYDDLVLVCGVEETCEKVAHLGQTIYLPLSIDTEYVKQFVIPKKEKTKERAYCGRPKKRLGYSFDNDVDIIEGLPRDEFLTKMADYKEVYAVGRTAIEAKLLKCRLLPYDNRYPKVSRWKVLDNKDAAEILQNKLNEIDGGAIIKNRGENDED